MRLLLTWLGIAFRVLFVIPARLVLGFLFGLWIAAGFGRH